MVRSIFRSLPLLGTLGAALLVTGCDTAEDPKPGPEWDMDLGTAALHLGAVGSCAEAEDAVREAAYVRVKRELYDEMMGWLATRESRCEEEDIFGYEEGGDMGSAAAGGYADGGDAGSDDGPTDVSETNNQVTGVDEADFLKNDDAFLYVLSGDSLHVVKSWPADETSRVGALAIEGTPKKLLLEGDLAVVFSSLPAPDGSQTYDDYGYYGGGYGGDECTYGYECVPRGDGLPTKITLVDLTDRANPTVVREVRTNGSLLTARRVGEVVHAVLTKSAPQFALDRNAGIHCEDGDAPEAEDIIEAFTDLLLENERIIRTTPLGEILPSVVDSAFPGEDALAACPSFYRGRLAAGAGFTTLLSFDLAQTGAVAASTVVSEPGVIYASAESLYMAVPEEQDDMYGWYEGYDQTPQLSVVHKFDLGTEGASSYVASGAVEGRVLNQFSMDEFEGNLRIATTNGHVPDPNVKSALTVLEQRGADLATIGRIGDIAPTEDIRSVRFSGDRGFIVTFKKTDPLFVFDLADPTAPRVLSELKIPGFSTYMHMMDDTHLLTIGYDADDHGDFAFFDGVLLQIFDVSDPTSPTLAHKEVIGTRGSSSEALTNHLAFNYFAQKDLLAIPMTICEGGDDGMYGSEMTFSGLIVYDVTASAGFSERGRLAFPMEAASDPYGEGASCSNWWTNASSIVRRSVIMDDFVYGITDERIQVASLADVEEPIASVELTLSEPAE